MGAKFIVYGCFREAVMAALLSGWMDFTMLMVRVLIDQAKFWISCWTSITELQHLILVYAQRLLIMVGHG